MDPGRRALLRALTLVGLAGCTPGGRTDSTAGGTARSTTTPSPAGDPTGAPAPSPTPTATASPSPSTTTPGPTPTPTVRTVVSRDLLELPPPVAGGTTHTITGLLLHHTAAPVGPVAQAPDRLRDHARNHQGAGFVDIAYHWGVDAAGTVYQLRDEAIAGETFTGYDPAGWLLVVCDGNFDEAEPTDAMLTAVADVLAAGAARHGVDPATLLGHRDLAATRCPGDGLHARLAEIVAMVRDRLARGGVTLATTDDPAALR